MLGITEGLQGTAAALGGVAGGALGAVSDTLQIPRRGLMQLLGLPEDGTELVSNLTGLDPESPWTKALGLGAEVATDPLTYLGGTIGRAAGGVAGRGLEAAALARGPRYAGGAEKLTELAQLAERKYGADPTMLHHLLQSPALAQAAGEVPEGSSIIGAGAEALALRTPQGDVLRIAAPMSKGGAAPARVNIPEVVQPLRDVVHGDLRVERLPIADQLYSSWQRRDLLPDISALRESITAKGLQPVDLHPGNLGDFGGELRVLDGGAVWPAGGEVPGMATQQPGALTNRLLDLLGADRRVQDYLARRAAPYAGRPTPQPGM